MSRFVCLFLLSLSLVSSVQLVHSAPLEPLVCLDEEDALNLLNQARPVDALMNYMYGALTDDEFSALIQRTKLVRIIDDPSGIVDIRRYVWASAWRLPDKPIVSFNDTGNINCTALDVGDATPSPDQVIILFHILATFQDLIVNDLCSSPNSVAIFVGTSSSTGAPIYVHGCEAGMTCSDTTP